MRSLPSVAFTIFPTSPPSPLLVCTCLLVWPSTRCHWPHWSASATSGVLVEEGFHARVCREAGARVRTNVMVRDFVPLAAGQRRLEVGADGLSLHGGPHLCHHWLETVQSSGVPTARTQFSWTRRRKERTIPDFGRGGWNFGCAFAVSWRCVASPFPATPHPWSPGVLHHLLPRFSPRCQQLHP